jgi:plasmid stabilization system protein ParE
MFEVIWLPDALKDLDRQFDFLNERDPKVASRAVRAILGAGAVVMDIARKRPRVSFGKLRLRFPEIVMANLNPS